MTSFWMNKKLPLKGTLKNFKSVMRYFALRHPAIFFEELAKVLTIRQRAREACEGLDNSSKSSRINYVRKTASSLKSLRRSRLFFRELAKLMARARLLELTRDRKKKAACIAHAHVPIIRRGLWPSRRVDTLHNNITSNLHNLLTT